jgi:hypothetical protein
MKLEPHIVKRVWIGAVAVCVLGVCLVAFGGRFAEIWVTPEPQIRVTVSTDGDSYYILHESSQPEAGDRAMRDMALGDGTDFVFQVSPYPGSDSGVFDVETVPVSDPRDSDKDGIDDVYELRNRHFLNPLNALDAMEDYDGDGAGNLDEITGGTAPAFFAESDGSASTNVVTFFGISPPLTGSVAALAIDISDQKISWVSSDSVLGDVDTGGLVGTDFWSLMAGSQPTRILFESEDGGIDYEGNVLLTAYNRAVVDLVADTSTVRYLLKTIDLDIDSDNTTFVDLPERDVVEETIEDHADKPGKLIWVNDADGDGDGVPGFADGFDKWGNEGAGSGGEFTPLVLEVPQGLDDSVTQLRFTYPESDPDGVTRSGAGTATDPHVYEAPAGELRIWTKNGNVDRKKSPDIGNGGHFVKSGMAYEIEDFGLDSNRTVTLYVEGIHGSVSQGVARIAVDLDRDGAGMNEFLHADAVRCTVINIDLDVDSDNTNGVEAQDESAKEDTLEDRTNNVPGKIVRNNIGDKNLKFTTEGGAVPNWADGIDKEHAAESGLGAVNNNDADASPKFVPLVLKLAGGVDRTKAKVKFTYSASDPDAIDRTVTARNNAHWVYPFVVGYTLPGAGDLRVWKKDGPVVRKAKKVTDAMAGDFVPSNTPIEVSKLGFTGDVTKVTFYVEAVKLSAGLGDRTVKVELDPTGTGTNRCSDQVRLTSTQVNFEQHPTGNKYGFDPTPQGIVPLRTLVQKINLNAVQQAAGGAPANSPHDDKQAFPNPSIPEANHPRVGARQVSLAYEADATHGKKTKVKISVVPNIESLIEMFRFKSTDTGKVKLGADPQAPVKAGAIWEVELEGVARHETVDTRNIFAFVGTDTSGSKYKIEELSAYAFKYAKLAYAYYRVEDSAQAGTTVSSKVSTTLSAQANNTNTLTVASAAGFEIGDKVLNGNNQLGTITAIDVGAKKITLNVNVNLANAATVYVITLAPADLTVIGRTPDQVLRKGVVRFNLTRDSSAATDSRYDIDPTDNSLTFPAPTKTAEEDKILSTLSKTRDDEIVIRIGSITGGTTGYAYPDGAIVLSDAGNLYTVTHEALHSVALRHHADSTDNVMWYVSGIKPELHNTPYREAENENKLEDTGGNQNIGRAWSKITR